MTRSEDLGQRLDELLASYRGGLNSVREYAAQRMLDLADALGEPGYEEAVKAARDSIALEAGMAAVDAADATDREMLGAIGGFLTAGAEALRP